MLPYSKGSAQKNNRVAPRSGTTRGDFRRLKTGGEKKKPTNQQQTSAIGFKKQTNPKNNTEAFPNQTVPFTGSSIKNKNKKRKEKKTIQKDNKQTKTHGCGIYAVEREGFQVQLQHTDLAHEATWQPKALGIQRAISDFMKTQGCASGKAA